ncbi:MAG: RDD family protein [Planctomycetota bacterium]
MGIEKDEILSAGTAGGVKPGWGWRVPGLLIVGAVPYAGILLSALLIRPRPSGEGAGIADLPPANAGPRILAGLIDLTLAFGLLQIPFVGWALASAFLLFRDSGFRGRSPGRRAMGLALVVRREGKSHRCTGDHRTSFFRNATIGLPGVQILFLPLEGVLVLLGRRRIGERLAPDTIVVRFPRETDSP